ncbi:hypothetical protein TNCT_678521 [Trichonephila clavata]|uniref:Uncharacterized protein n=1 Tax=Trichonephila clavata TaxID=2740835 RepID=A0A8X6LNM0_TRICU|nr:hypothetical protein TNCT_678521 [Trichonephila clavata]
MAKSENKDKNVGHTINQIKTISNQNDSLFIELQYVDVIVDDIPLIATLDSGANSVIINKKYMSAKKKKSSFSNNFNQLFRRTENCKRFRIYDLIEREENTNHSRSSVREIEAEI